MPTINTKPLGIPDYGPSENKINRLKVYRTQKWKKLRESKLMDCPYCEECMKEDILTTTNLQVHHIIPLEDDLSLAFVWDNLQVLCSQCHSKKHNNRRYNENKR